MEENPDFKTPKEEALEKDAMPLPYYREEKHALPKDYDKTIERMAARLDQSEPSSSEGKALLGIGLALSSILMLVQAIELLGYPRWLDGVHHLLIFVEATIPFVVSFFLKNPKYATLMRLAGIIVLLTYLFTLFW